MITYMLTTVDNPFDPFTQFDEWNAFDLQHGYNTSSYLARIVRTSDELSQPDQDLAIQQAIEEIARLNVRGIHIRITADEGRAIREQNQKVVKHSEDRLVHISKAIDETFGENYRQTIEKEN